MSAVKHRFQIGDRIQYKGYKSAPLREIVAIEPDNKFLDVESPRYVTKRIKDGGDESGSSPRLSMYIWFVDSYYSLAEKGPESEMHTTKIKTETTTEVQHRFKVGDFIQWPFPENGPKREVLDVYIDPEGEPRYVTKTNGQEEYLAVSYVDAGHHIYKSTLRVGDIRTVPDRLYTYRVKKINGTRITVTVLDDGLGEFQWHESTTVNDPLIGTDSVIDGQSGRVSFMVECDPTKVLKISEVLAE